MKEMSLWTEAPKARTFYYTITDNLGMKSVTKYKKNTTYIHIGVLNKSLHDKLVNWDQKWWCQIQNFCLNQCDFYKLWFIPNDKYGVFFFIEQYLMFD